MRNALKVLFVVALAIPTMASAVIANTKHNLTSTGPGSVKFTDTAADICRFCHLVHDANTANGHPLGSRGPDRPRLLHAERHRQRHAARRHQRRSWAPARTKCLSCHDGTVALNIVVNNASVTQIVAASNTAVGNVVAGGGGMQLRGSTYLSSLNGQHPVGLPFAGQTGSSAVNARVRHGQRRRLPARRPGLRRRRHHPDRRRRHQAVRRRRLLPGRVRFLPRGPPDNVAGNYPYFLRVPGTVTNGRCGACHKK